MYTLDIVGDKCVRQLLPMTLDGLALLIRTIRLGASKGPCKLVGGILDFGTGPGISDTASVGVSVIGAGLDVILGAVVMVSSSVERKLLTIVLLANITRIQQSSQEVLGQATSPELLKIIAVAPILLPVAVGCGKVAFVLTSVRATYAGGIATPAR